MNLKFVPFTFEDKYIADFIHLAHKLYDKKNLTQNDKELMDLLKGTHVLSTDFKMYKFCIYNDEDIVGRFAFTVYPKESVAYIGFFECVDNEEVAKFLFDNAVQFAQEKGFHKIVGPLDASFWLKYRLKINYFEDAPYTGEPYNMPYYYKLFADNGFTVKEHYVSSVYKKLDGSYKNKKFADIYEDFTKRGYRIENPDLNKWDEIVVHIHRLINELYSTFPTYKPISLHHFSKLFADYKKIIDTKMSKIVYYKGLIVGFYISVPNYGNSVYLNRSVSNILRILSVKFFPKTYVMLYIGAKREHRGVGSAMIGSVIEELKTNGCVSIGALQRDGNKSQRYATELIEKKYEYVLLEKDL